MPAKAIERLGDAPSSASDVEGKSLGEIKQGLHMDLDTVIDQMNQIVDSNFKPGAIVDRTSSKNDDSDSPSASEAVLASFLEMRDELIGCFEAAIQGATDAIPVALEDAIGKVESHIKLLGGEVEPFNPAKHASGLSANIDLLMNAKKVVENTTKSYNLYKIADIQAGRHAGRTGRPCIVLKIAGDLDSKPFTVQGTIIAKTDFSGNEAVDFVVAEGKGFMTVKAPSLGKFVDVSRNFDIKWQQV
jgi:hypothetical protein